MHDLEYNGKHLLVSRSKEDFKRMCMKIASMIQYKKLIINFVLTLWLYHGKCTYTKMDRFMEMIRKIDLSRNILRLIEYLKR